MLFRCGCPSRYKAFKIVEDVNSGLSAPIAVVEVIVEIPDIAMKNGSQGFKPLPMPFP